MITLFLYCLLDYKDIPVTKWISEDSTKPMSYREFIEKNPYQPFACSLVYTSPNFSSNILLVLCEKEIFNDLTSELEEYIEILERKKWSIILYTVEGGTPEGLKQLIIDIYDSTWAELDLVFMIGKLPVAWFQMIDDWDNDGERDPEDGYEEFPCDLFYEDIDGFWTDSLKKEGDNLVPGKDGIYDTHTGSIYPEIAIGRLYPISTTSKQDIELFKNYFKKLKKYRTKEDTLLHRALVYVDDDWVCWAKEYAEDMKCVFDNRVLIADSEQTKASDYRERLSENYKWISVFAHSSPELHGFKYNNGTVWSYFYATEIFSIDPKAYFYNLFACSNCRYVEPGYMGGRYVFASSYGISAVGSTKTGSMLFFSQFYSPLGAKSTIGEALKKWFNLRTLTEPWQRSWFYGITLLGDPTLSPIEEPTPGIKETLSSETLVIKNTIFMKEGAKLNFNPPPERLNIYSVSGELLKTVEKPNYLNFPAGVYFYRYAYKGNIYIGKLIIMQ